MKPLKTNAIARTGSTETGYNSVVGTLGISATVETARPKFSDLSKAQRQYARSLQVDEGWSRSEAILLAYHDGGAR